MLRWLNFSLAVVGILIAAVSTASAQSFIGTWQTQWTDPPDPPKNSRIIVMADDEQGKLDGTIIGKGWNGLMYGTLSSDGRTWKGNTCVPDGEWKCVHGPFEITLNPDNKSFKGTWDQVGRPNQTGTKRTWMGTKVP